MPAQKPLAAQRWMSTQTKRLHLGQGEAWALAGALFYALSNVFTAVAVRGHELNYWLGVSLRAIPTLLLGLALWPSARRRDPAAVSPLADWRLLVALIASGLLNFVIGSPLLFAALAQGGVLVASPITGTQTLWSATIAALLLHQPLNRRMTLGMLVSAAGVALLTLGHSSGVALLPRWWLAVPYATGTAASWALAGVLIAYALQRHVDRFQALAVTVLTGAACVNGYLLLTGRLGLYLTTPGPLMWKVVVAGALGAAGLISFTTALGLTSVASANALNSLQVGMAPLIAWLFVGEAMNGWMGLGILLIMFGAMVVQLAKQGRAERVGG